jgi:uncharacterized protein DUF4184
MPLTWFAHQVPAVGLKLARPRWFDATALCVGSMMPDLMYSFSGYVHIDTHEWPAFTIGVPLTIVLATVVRALLAPLAPAQLPDLGDLRLRSYGVLAARRPVIVVTIMSAVLGVASHVVLDWFTHPGRPGARWLGYDDVDLTIAGHTEPLAGAFQLIGHTVGSVAGVGLLLLIGRRRLLERWYGHDAVDAVRAQTVDRRRCFVFWGVTTVGLLAGIAWGSGGDRLESIQRPFVAMLLAACLAAVLVRQRARYGGRAIGGAQDSPSVAPICS